MAGNIWRAFSRNPELGQNLSDFFGALKERSNREEQYAALQELLFPKGERPVMANPATIALRGGGTAQLPRFQGRTETYQGPARTISELSPQESMRLAAILKMAPANAVDLMSRIEEANLPRQEIVHDPYLGIGTVRTQRGKEPTYRQLAPGVPRPQAAVRQSTTKSVTRTIVGKDNKPHDVLFMFDNLGNELSRKDLGISYQKPTKGTGGEGGAGGLSDVDTRFFLGRIKELTVSNANLGKEATELMARYKKSPDGETITYVDEKGQTVPVKGDAARQLWTELETKLNSIYRQIDQNDQILLHDNQKVGGTWKIPDRGKERNAGKRGGGF